MIVPVTDAASLATAIQNAKAGDEIVLANGTYAMTGASCTAAGTPTAPIIVRAATPLGARIDMNALEGFKVSAPNWHFEGLDIHGTCANDSDCEHAFHVTGAASGFVMRKNRVVDFNAQLKVNASQTGAGNTWEIPNGGLVEYNELFDAHARNTGNPVTPLNIDTGDGWIVRGNYIHDFHRAGSSSPTYGSFMKSGSTNGLYERNLVICTKDEATTGVYIGLSFGGGGTGAQYCAPAFDANVPCAPEHTNGTMRNNIVVNCSDVGIYLNQAKNTHLLFNTLIATTGVDFRFATSSGEARGNVVSGPIRTRDGATAPTLAENLLDVTQQQFDGFYVAPLIGDLRKKGDLSSLLGKGTAIGTFSDDYCARTRTGAWDLGALQASLGDCVTTTPPVGGGGTTLPDGGTAGTDGGGITTSPDGGTPPGDNPNNPNGSPSSASGDDGGCGCRTTPTRSSTPLTALALTLLAATIARRRFRANSQRPTANGGARRP